QLFGANTLHRALGLDRSLRRLGGWRSPEGADLLITVLAARDGYIFWVDLLAESGKLVRSELVAASYHRAQTLDFRRHLGVGNDLAAGVLDKAEIAWPVIMVMGVLVAASSRPYGTIQGQNQTQRRGCRKIETSKCKLHPVLFLLSGPEKFLTEVTSEKIAQSQDRGHWDRP